MGRDAFKDDEGGEPTQLSEAEIPKSPSPRQLLGHQEKIPVSPMGMR